MEELTEAQGKLKEAANKVVDEVDKGYMRQIQREVHLCQAQCFENKRVSSKEVYGCEEQCASRIYSVQKKIESEFSLLSEQLDRCVKTCQDKQIQQHGPDPNKYTNEQRKSVEEGFGKCASGCVSEQFNQLPKIKARLIEFFKNV